MGLYIYDLSKALIIPQQDGWGLVTVLYGTQSTQFVPPWTKQNSVRQKHLKSFVPCLMMENTVIKRCYYLFFLTVVFFTSTISKKCFESISMCDIIMK